MKKIKISVSTWIALGSLGIAILSFYFSYNVDRENIALKKDQFYMNNVPNVIVKEAFLFSGKTDTNSVLDSTKLNIAIELYNKSNQTVRFISYRSLATKESDFVLRNIYEVPVTNHNETLKVHHTVTLDKSSDILKPNEGGITIFNIPFEEIKYEKTYIHFNFVYESEKGGYYDRYLILTIIRKTKEPIVETILKSLNIDVFGDETYQVTEKTTEQIVYSLEKYIDISHTYLSNEMFIIDELLGK